MNCVHGVDMEQRCAECVHLNYDEDSVALVYDGNYHRAVEIKSVILDQEFLKAAQSLTDSAKELRNAVDALNATVGGMQPKEVGEVKRGPITDQEARSAFLLWINTRGGNDQGWIEVLTDFAKSRGLL